MTNYTPEELEALVAESMTTEVADFNTITAQRWRKMSDLQRRAFDIVCHKRQPGVFWFVCTNCGFSTGLGCSGCEACE